jgi:DNA topoisomerase IB
VNAYIKEVAGAEFTAKDFRTWTATVLAAVGVAVSSRAAGSRTARKRAIARIVQEVAFYLGNTPAVCRSSYIDPRVFDRFAAGVTIGDALDALGDVDFGEPATQGPIEAAVVELLDDESAPVLARAA